MCEPGLRRGTRRWNWRILIEPWWLGATLAWTLLPVGFLPLQAAAPAFECFPVSDLERVFEDGYGTNRQPGNLSLAGLRGETLSAQCALLAHEDVEGLAVSAGPLQQRPGAGVIPAENIRCNFVGSIFIEKNSPNRQPESLVRPAPAWFPDVLTDERACSVKQGMRKGVYLTIRIPPDASPGDYQGVLRATASGATVTLPLALKVYPLTLPAERHLLVTEWFSTSQFRKHHQLDSYGSERFHRLLETYARNMAEHRQNVFRVELSAIESRRAAEGKLEFEFSQFDKLAQVFWDTGRMDALETGFIARFGKGGWAGSEILLDDFPVKETDGRRVMVPGKEFLPQFLPAFVRHLRAKGWLGKTLFHICDEPSDHNVTAWRAASDFIHELAPELRRIDAIETPHCLNALEVWVPKLDHLATWNQSYEQAQRQGNELWFYTVGIFQGGSLLNKTVDVPLIETRLMHWLNYRYDLRGYLHWGFNEWTDDPINRPGEHRGDGWHVYPTPNGLLDSLRWEQMRNGLEDYECLWLLESKTAQLRTTLPARVAAFIEPRQRGVEIASELVGDYYEHTSDPEKLYQARREAIEEALALEQSPRIILQTTPLEHAPVGKGCAVDLHGWVEPGTLLSASGETIPVAPDGLFLAQVPPSAEGRIILEAKGKNGSKRLIRQFRNVEVQSAPGSIR